MPPKDSQPQLVYHSSTTAIYRWRENDDDTGIKVVLGDRDDAGSDGVDALLREHAVSTRLSTPPAVAARRTVAVSSFRGRPALRFEWADGNTLKEWLRKSRGVDAFNVRLRAGAAVARTLADFHVGGVAYNALRPENVVLSPGNEGGYVATFVDLKDAVEFNAGSDEGRTRREREADLRDLGRVLDQIFRGRHDAAVIGEDGALEVGRHGEDSGDLIGPGGGRRRSGGGRRGLPLCLQSLVASLVEVPLTSPGAGLGYQNADDVYHDLKAIADGDLGEGVGRSRIERGVREGRLNFRDFEFCGWTEQPDQILELFRERVAKGEGRPQMATISGYAGTGKSTMVHRLKKPLVQDHKARFIGGKFDPSSRWDTVLASALDSFFASVLEEEAGKAGGPANLPLKWRILDAVGSVENSVLLELLPNLQSWLMHSPKRRRVAPTARRSRVAPTAKMKRNGASIRLKFMFCKLVGAIPSRDRPLVFFLDDLQWADEVMLDIIDTIMTDPGVHHLLFLGSSCANKYLSKQRAEDKKHLWNARLDAIERRGVHRLDINVGPIDSERVRSLLSEALCLPPGLCRLLSAEVHNKTGGIMRHMLDFLHSINEDGSLWFSAEHRRWVFNLERIKRKEVNKAFRHHLIELMPCMSRRIRMGLKVAACLGPKFHTQLLDKVREEYKINDSFLPRCVELGLLAPLNLNEHGWAHEEVRRAAFDLLPEARRESFPLLLGTRLLVKSSSREMKDANTLFVVVDNMNRGSGLISDGEQQVEVSQLNLQAGERALADSAFHSAAQYLATGVELLEKEGHAWEEHYSLAINLHDAASEALFVTGDFTRLSSLIKKPLKHARSIEDKLNIYNNLIRSLAASSQYAEGLTSCVSILSELGEDIPTEITDDMHRQEVENVKKLLGGMSRKEFLSLPVMANSQKEAAMHFLSHTITITSVIKPQLNPILVFRMVKLSIKHGLCGVSAFAFASYGAWLTGGPGLGVDAGHRMGQVATEMMHLLGAGDMVPRLNTTVYGSINIWKEPWQVCQTKLMEAYDSGTISGDTHYAMTALYQCSNSAIFGCGDNLKSLSQSIQLYATRAFQCNQRNIWKSLLVLHQLTLDLRGVEQNAFTSYSIGTTEESCFASSRDQNEILTCRLICDKRKYVALFTGDIATAADMHKLCQEFPTGSIGQLLSACVGTFVDGLTAFFLARKHGEDEAKWVDVGNKAILLLRKWTKNSNWNFSNKLYLLEAECCSLIDHSEKALFYYNASIQAARDHRFIHEEGLAEEKLGSYLGDKNMYSLALMHYANAKECYKRWGAKVIAKRMDETIAKLLPLCPEMG